MKKNFICNLSSGIASFFRDPFNKRALQKAESELQEAKIANVGYMTLCDVLKEENEAIEKRLQKTDNARYRAEYDLNVYRKRYAICEAVMKMQVSAGTIEPLTISQLKKLYEELKSEIDPEGYARFVAAQHVLGSFDCGKFPYEDNTGFFEVGADNLYAALLVQYEHKLGQPKKDRWEIVQSSGGYERCKDWSIDESTPEFVAFEKAMYKRLFNEFFLGQAPFAFSN